MKKYLVVVAGGAGKRMGGEIPKQFVVVCGRPVLIHTVQRFVKYDPGIEIIIVLPTEWIGYWNTLSEKYNFRKFDHIVEGGKERFHSVRNGLAGIRAGSLVAIHDAVRPLVNIDTIRRCFNEAEKKGNAIPVMTPPESVRIHTAEGENSSLDRSNVKLIQTPQVFKSDLILKAYEQEYSPVFTDDATVLEAAGIRINLVEGNRENIKITTAEDLAFAETLLSKQ
ncbi:MAG TPA: 2-C-methyl-D-erythritol 4-phosphate cytidylyltransferase [Bacteroidales bacterium]|nr:2-C-methyl-D-erythritol 4-phosphate cytidylyltransferase [Bacteroidales bacterium]